MELGNVMQKFELRRLCGQQRIKDKDAAQFVFPYRNLQFHLTISSFQLTLSHLQMILSQLHLLFLYIIWRFLNVIIVFLLSSDAFSLSSDTSLFTPGNGVVLGFCFVFCLLVENHLIVVDVIRDFLSSSDLGRH